MGDVKFQAQITDPDSLEVTIEITMTLKEWMKLDNQFKTHTSWPASWFHRKINETVSWACEKYIMEASDADKSE